MQAVAQVKRVTVPSPAWVAQAIFQDHEALTAEVGPTTDLVVDPASWCRVGDALMQRAQQLEGAAG